MAEHESLVVNTNDKFVNVLNKFVLFGVRILAFLAVLVIYWTLADVGYHVYRQFLSTYNSIFNIENIFSVLGAILAVLIAIEVFLNIIFYLKKDAVHVPLVLSTALTAIARKVIVLDYSTIESSYLYGTAALILAVGLSYWLVTKKGEM